MAQETSSCASYARETEANTSRDAIAKRQGHRWYRDLHRWLWFSHALSAIEKQQVLERIASTEGERTSAEHLDTIIGYRSGNWAFEWTKEAQKWSTLQTPTSLRTSLKAIESYSSASYPHLRSDLLASMAQQQGRTLYFACLASTSVQVQEICLSIDGRELRGLLHLVSEQAAPSPTVLIIGDLTNLQTDYLEIFLTHLQIKGIAMCSFDLPGVGLSSAWALTEETSNLHKKIVQELTHIPWIDSTRLFLLGIGIGANIALRLGYLLPKKIRGVLLFSGLLHKGLYRFTEPPLPSPMFLDAFASAFHREQSHFLKLQASIRSCSLLVQGFLRTALRTPALLLSLEKDANQSQEDASLIANAHHIHTIGIPIKHRCLRMKEALQKVTAWLQTLV